MRNACRINLVLCLLLFRCLISCGWVCAVHTHILTLGSMLYEIQLQHSNSMSSFFCHYISLPVAENKQTNSRRESKKKATMMRAVCFPLGRPCCCCCCICWFWCCVLYHFQHPFSKWTLTLFFNLQQYERTNACYGMVGWWLLLAYAHHSRNLILSIVCAQLVFAFTLNLVLLSACAFRFRHTHCIPLVLGLFFLTLFSLNA